MLLHDFMQYKCHVD